MSPNKKTPTAGCTAVRAPSARSAQPFDFLTVGQAGGLVPSGRSPALNGAASVRAFTSSGTGRPCPVCGRTTDGDCRTHSDGRVFCHTHTGKGLKPGDPDPDGAAYRFIGNSTGAHELGMWKPAASWTDRGRPLRQRLQVSTHRPTPAALNPQPKAEARPAEITLAAKLVRPQGQTLFHFARWDGTPVEATKVRNDHGNNQPKEVKWRPALSKEGLTQADLAPWNWHEAIAVHKQDGGPVVVLKGELKAQWLNDRGVTAISINGWDPTLEQQLKPLGNAVVLAPDCDLADLEGWYAKAAAALPQARHLMVPGADWALPPEKDGVGIDDWLQSQPAITAEEIIQAVADQRWGGGGEREEEEEEGGRVELLSGAVLLRFIEDHYKVEWNELKQRAVVNGVTPRGDDKKLFYLEISNRFPLVKVKKEEALDSLDYLARQNPFNPVERYIDGVKEKAERGEIQLLKLADIASKGFGLDDWLSQLLLAHKLVQHLKRGLQPGYKADEMAIIQGRQGGYKTEAIKALSPDPTWCVTATEVKDTDEWKFLLKISQSWFYLLDECDKFLRGKDSSTLKSIITNGQDSYAKKGLNDVDDHPRPSTLWGTTNETELLNDHTGVRRWWLMQQAEGCRANPGWVQSHRDDIWATVYTWAMWGLEGYLPDGSEVQKGAEARAWAATYSLDGADKYVAILSAIPIQDDGLPLPISQQTLILQATEIDIGRLRMTDRKRAQDLIGDVSRTIKADNFSTHDGQIRWVKDKRRIPGHANAVAGYFPERVAAPAAKGKQQADSFQVDPIPRVPSCSEAVPWGWNGQTLWQETVLSTLFQRSIKKEELKEVGSPDSAADGAVGCDGPDSPQKDGTLEHLPQIPSAGSDLPVPSLGTFDGTPSEQTAVSAPRPLPSADTPSVQAAAANTSNGMNTNQPTPATDTWGEPIVPSRPATEHGFGPELDAVCDALKAQAETSHQEVAP